MANAIYTHEFEEAISTHQEFIVTGKNKILWGLIEWPAGYYHKDILPTGLCKYCGLTEDTHKLPLLNRLI